MNASSSGDSRRKRIRTECLDVKLCGRFRIRRGLVSCVAFANNCAVKTKRIGNKAIGVLFDDEL